MVRRQRLTEEFVRHHRWLRERTGDMPTALATVLEQQPDLALSIRELDLIWSVLDRHRRTSKARFVVQAHPEFSNAMRDYEERWRDSYGTLLNWEHHRETGQSLSDWFDEVLDEASRSTSVEDNGDEEWDFDPDLHSASAHVEGIADYIEGKANDAPFFSRAAQSFRWLFSLPNRAAVESRV